MTNEVILQKLEEGIHLRGFSHHTHEEYMIRAKSFMLYANRLLEELTEQEIRAYLLYLLDVKNYPLQVLMDIIVPFAFSMVRYSIAISITMISHITKVSILLLCVF